MNVGSDDAGGQMNGDARANRDAQQVPDQEEDDPGAQHAEGTENVVGKDGAELAVFIVLFLGNAEAHEEDGRHGRAGVGAGVADAVGTATGVICAGAKEGCANKVGLSCANATMSAMMALEGFSIEAGGIVTDNDVAKLIRNMSRVANVGMKDANATIVDIMMGR